MARYYAVSWSITTRTGQDIIDTAEFRTITRARKAYHSIYDAARYMQAGDGSVSLYQVDREPMQPPCYDEVQHASFPDFDNWDRWTA